MDIYQKITELRSSGKSVALVTVIKTSGSVPRDAGSKMIVLGDGKIEGTIGGSSVEALVIKDALQVIKNNKPRTVTYDLHDADEKSTGMVCGGTMEFFIEPLAAQVKLYIFGGGHIGYHLARFARSTGFEYIVIDDREAFASNERFPDSKDLMVGDPGTIAGSIPIAANDYVVIVTRGHKDDYQVLRRVINAPARYIGMIASKTKRNEIFAKLKNDDRVSEVLLKKVFSPVGLDIGAETPEEIAVSILAEMIKVRRMGATEKK